MEKTGCERLCEERLFLMSPHRPGRARGMSADVPVDHYFQCGGTTPVFIYRSGWRS